MKLNGLTKKLVHAIEAAVAAAPQLKAAQTRQIRADGFEAPRSTPVNLGKPAPASAAADGAYVTSLYRDLLGRAPDADGFRAHINGLQSGMSRDEIRQVFLTSPEFRQKSAVPQAPAALPGPEAPVQKTGVDQLRALIAADIKLSSGGRREATEADYAYWLPKLVGPCDSGVVTSGQMTGVEYYHRRMLGWQAGGADMAVAGPYAGSPDAHGPVPSATDMVGPLSVAATPASGSTEQLRRLIAADIKLSSGGREATERDYAYWLPMLQGPCDSGYVTSGQMTGVEYYHRRMLGWQAGGADMAVAGPYAGSPDARGPVPSAVDVVGPLQ